MKIHNINLIFFDPKGFNMAYKMLIALLWGGWVCVVFLFCFAVVWSFIVWLVRGWV